MTKQKVYFKTFGCRTNIFDTQVMKHHIRSFECVDNEDIADIVVVNSCTVTNGADAGVRNYLRKMHQRQKKIFLTGCGVSTKGKDIFTQNLVYGVFAHSFKEKIDECLNATKPFFYAENRPSFLDETLITHFAGRTRAFIKIQEGCDFACSYCIIPFARGKARSYPREKILREISTLADNGISEIVLTGTNVGSFGKDLDNYNLARLIKDIDRINTIKRVRIGSLEPSQIDSEFKDILSLPIMERHLHIALQHTSDTMLTIMNRHNRTDNDLELFNEIALKGFCLGSDFIIGHPGESDEVWEEAFRQFKCFPLTHLHPFIYSKRDGTASSAMKHNVRGNVSKDRLHLLKNYVAKCNYDFRIAHKQPLEVLIESRIANHNRLDSNTNIADDKSSDGFIYSGFDQFFNRVHIHSKKDNLIGQWLKIDSYLVNKDGNYADI